MKLFTASFNEAEERMIKLLGILDLIVLMMLSTSILTSIYSIPMVGAVTVSIIAVPILFVMLSVVIIDFCINWQ